MSSQDLPKPDFVKNMKLIGYSDQGGREDGVQVMVNKGHAFVGHMFSKGFSVIDVRDPRKPKPVKYVPAPHNTWTIHLQTHGDLLLVINARDMFAAPEFQDERKYYIGSHSDQAGEAEAAPAVSATGPRALPSMTLKIRRSRARSASCRSKAAAFIASGTPAAVGPMSRRCSTASPITSS